jgi:hypothetical protein
LCKAIAKSRIFPPFIEITAEQNQVRLGQIKSNTPSLVLLIAKASIA